MTQTTVDIPAERVLEGAAGCEEVIIIGAKDGEPYYASSLADVYQQLWMIEKFKLKLLMGMGQ